jgi:hypothetical protein
MQFCCQHGFSIFLWCQLSEILLTLLAALLGLQWPYLVPLKRERLQRCTHKGCGILAKPVLSYEV